MHCQLIRRLFCQNSVKNALTSRQLSGCRISYDYNGFFNEKIEARRRSNTYRVFKTVNRDAFAFPAGDEFSCGKRRIIVWCSNDVLGLSCHPQVKQAVHEALERYGAGSGGPRAISGTSLLHETLERELADFHGKEAAFVSTSGFLSNTSSISTLAKLLPGCQIFSASDNHASVVEGILASKAQKHIFRCGDVNHLKELLSLVDSNAPKIVIFESISSMTGLRCAVDELCAVARQYGALTFVDEVHAVGLYGPTGAGIGQLINTTDNMDVIVGSFGKALGNIGAYVASNSLLLNTLRSYAPGFIYTTALPAMTLAGSLAALRIVKSQEGVELRRKHSENVTFLKNLFQSAGIPVERNDSHIIPVLVGDPSLCTEVSNLMINTKGHYMPDVNHPVVPKGEERLRITPTPYHTKEMMTSMVEDLAELWDVLKISQRKKLI